MSPLLDVAFATLLAGSVLAPAAPAAAAADPDKPNVVLIVSDDQGWADIGCHADEIRSPHLDRLCREGVELDFHYVQPQCTPTRVALMTGRDPTRFGNHCAVASNEHAFPHETVTLASLLQAAGYETAPAGKWRLGSRPEWGPNGHGFDQSYGSPAGAVGMYDSRDNAAERGSVAWLRDVGARERISCSTGRFRPPSRSRSRGPRPPQRTPSGRTCC